MKLWSGRFAASTHPILDAINKSISFDIRLWPYDIRTNRAHAEMLRTVGLLSRGEIQAIRRALDSVAAELSEGTFVVDESDEDIHMAIERRVTELVGDPGRKLHTGRSRNDQVATDMRLFVIDAIDSIRSEIRQLAAAFVDLAERNIEAVLPAYTHLQPGQPTLFGHHMLAYVEMLRRDDARLESAAKRAAVSPLGAGACVGSSLPLDRALTAELLGFDAASRNSLDAVSDRDFVVETLAALALLGVHLSRLGEELVLWSSKEFAFCVLGDDVSTGSSMMPQKKNPDGAELIRGKAGRIIGDLTGLLTALKGLPLAYNKDMQEDKEPLFDAVDTITLCLQMATVMIETLEIDADKMRASVSPDVFATDLVELLVLDGFPLRSAHEAVGRLVRAAEDAEKTIVQLAADEVNAAAADDDTAVDPVFIEKLTVAHAINSKALSGGTATERVLEAIAEARAWVKED